MDPERDDYADTPDRAGRPWLLKLAVIGLAATAALPALWFAALLLVYGRGK